MFYLVKEKAKSYLLEIGKITKRFKRPNGIAKNTFQALGGAEKFIKNDRKSWSK